MSVQVKGANQADVAAIRAVTDVIPDGGALTTIETMQQLVGYKVYYDDTFGVAGTAFPIGTAGRPVNNPTDLKAIAIARNLNALVIRGAITLNANFDNYNFEGSRQSWDGGETDEVTLGGQSVDACTFKHLYITGAQGGGNIDTCYQCHIGSVTAFEGVTDGCSLDNVTLGGHSKFNDSVGLAGAVTSNYNTWFRGLKGQLDLRGLAAALTINIWAQGATITIAASCTGGTINIYGSAVLIDNNGGTTVNDYTVETKLNTKVSPMDFWSDLDDVIDLPVGPTDTALPSVVVSGLPAGVTLDRVVAILKVRAIENTNAGGPNAIDGAQVIQVQKGAGAWATAINLADNQWTVAASTREAGDVLIGDNDIKATVDGDATYNFQFDAAAVDLASLRLNDVIVGLRFYFSTS